MNANELLKSRFLKQSDFGEPTRVEIARFEEMDVAKPGEKPDVKAVLWFKGSDRPMVLNSTNTRRLIKGLGDETDEWTGREIEIYVDDDVEYAGQIVGGLRVKALPRKSGKKRSAAATEPEDAIDGIAAMSDDWPRA